LPATRLGSDQVSVTGATPDVVGRVIAELGVVIHEMRLERSKLEDVFFSLTSGREAAS
jgi:hypothetical protein